MSPSTLARTAAPECDKIAVAYRLREHNNLRLILARGQIDSRVTDELRQIGIVVIDGLQRAQLEAATRLADAPLVHDGLSGLCPDLLGRHCVSLCRSPSEMIHPTDASRHRYVLRRAAMRSSAIQDTEPFTLILQSSTSFTLGLSETALWTCMSRLRNALRCGMVLRGGGIVELDCASALRAAAEAKNSEAARASAVPIFPLDRTARHGYIIQSRVPLLPSCVYR